MHKVGCIKRTFFLFQCMPFEVCLSYFRKNIALNIFVDHYFLEWNTDTEVLSSQLLNCVFLY